MAKLNIPLHKMPVDIPTPDEAFNSMLGVNPKPVNYSNNIIEIEIDKLIPYETPEGETQPFDLYSNEDLEELAEGIKSTGVLSPVIVRPHKEKVGCYEIIAGHNRTNASKMAGLFTVPCIIKNIDDDEAEGIMLDTNLNQRKELKPSELANAYKRKLALENKQGQRTDLTSRQNVVKFTPSEKRKAQRYARLTYLLPSLLVLVNEKKLSVMAGVEISYISQCNQIELYKFMDGHQIKISVEQAEKLRELEKETSFDEDVLSIFFFPPKKPKESTPKNPTSIKINFIDIEEYVDITREDLENYIIQAISAYSDKDEY